MKRASIATYAIFLVIIAGLAYLFYMQNREYAQYKQSSKSQISSLENKIKNLESKLNQKKSKDSLKKEVKRVKQEKKIPKDAVVIKLPKVPKVPKVPQVVTLGSSKIKEDKIKQLSMDMPIEVKPKKTTIKDNNQSKESKKIVGLEEFGRVSTYLRAPLKGNVEDTLKKAGFTILAVEQINSNLKSIVFTNKTLQNMGMKSSFIANLRASVDKKNKTISIQNPIYFAKAFMQDSYNEKQAKELLKDINSAFNDLKTSKDKLKSSLLPKYQFMFGMPYYKDMITVAKGSNAQELLSKVHKNSIIFKQKIDNNHYILGIKLNSEQFINKIGTNNASLLPYPLIIENGTAKILDPKYYIAISYPMLKMSQFMSISSVPDEIEQNVRNILKWKY